MALLYLSMMFVICLSIYAVYYAKTNKNNKNENGSISSEMLDKMSNNKMDGFEKFQNYMKKPSENISKILSLLESLSLLYNNIKTPLDDLSTLKDSFDTVKDSIKHLNNNELNNLIKEIQNDILKMNVLDKISALEQKVDSLKLLTSNIKIPNELESTIASIDTFIKEIHKNLEQFRKTVKKVEEINISDDILKIETNLKALPEVLKINKETKQLIGELTPIISSDIKNKINEFYYKYINEATKTLTGVDAIVDNLGKIKTQIDNIPLDKISELSNQLQNVGMDTSHNNRILDIVKSDLSHLKTQIDKIDLDSLSNIKGDISEIRLRFKRVLDVLKPGARNLLQDAVLIIKDTPNPDYTITVKNSSYLPEELQNTIRDLLKSDKDKFKLKVTEDIVEVEYSKEFHMGNHLRDLLGLERVDSNIFMKQYRSKNSNNFNHVILETLVHKLSIDAIIRRFKGSFKDQIGIISRIPNQIQSITAQIDNTKQNQDLKTISNKLVKFEHVHDTLQKLFDHIRNNFTPSELFDIVDVFLNINKYKKDFLNHFHIQENNLEFPTILGVLDTKLSTERKNLHSEIVKDITKELKEMQQDQINKQEFLAIAGSYGELSKEITNVSNKLHQKLSDKINELKLLIEAKDSKPPLNRPWQNRP